MFEDHFTDPSIWRARLDDLPSVLRPLLPKDTTLTTLTKAQSDRCVAAAIWHLLLGVRLSEAECDTIALWGASGYAGYFIFPRLIQRIAFNMLAKKVQSLFRSL